MKFKFSILLLATTIILNFLQGCKKNEKDIYKPYYGTWYARGCASSGGPQNCGHPYPIPRDRNITLTLNIDKTFVETSGNFTKQGTYTIQRVKDPSWTGSDIKFDKLTQVYNGQHLEYKIEIEADGSLNFDERSVWYNYTK